MLLRPKRRLIRPISPFAFPGRSPGFDPSHVGAQATRFSGVSVGTTFVDLLTGKPGTVVGTPGFVMDGQIGPSTRFFNSTDGSTFAGKPTGPFTAYTLAAIVSFDSVATVQSVICSSNASQGASMRLGSSTSINLLINGSGTLVLTTPVSANTPYLLIGSLLWSTTLIGSLVLMNMQTGQIATFSGSTASTTPTSDTGTCLVGNRTTQPTLGHIAAAMYSTNAISLQAMLAWAAEPWSFWYPK